MRGNDRTTIATLLIVAALVLATACFNLVNLSTASASRRARKWRLRKVLGARRQQLVAQFLGESLVVATVTVAMLIALAAVELLLAPYAAFLDADLSLTYLGERRAPLLPIVGLVLLIGIAGGLYPASICRASSPAWC